MIAEAMVLTGPRNLERRQMTIPDVGDAVRSCELKHVVYAVQITNNSPDTCLPASHSFQVTKSSASSNMSATRPANAGAYRPASAWPSRCSGPAETARSVAAANTGDVR